MSKENKNTVKANDEASKVEALTKEEQKQLAECEAAIKTYVESFYQVGKALRQIQDEKLYKEKYNTFDEYCASKWEMDDSHAYRLIEAAKVMEKLEEDYSPTGEKVLPANEAQVRPLTTLKANQYVAAWAAAVERANGGRMTAVIVQKAVDEKYGKTGATKQTSKKTPKDDSSTGWKKVLTLVESAEQKLKADKKDEVAKLLGKIKAQLEKLKND